MLRSCKALPHAAQRAPSHGGKGHRTALEGQGFCREEARGTKEPFDSNNRYTATLCLANSHPGPTILTVLFQAADKGSRKRYEPSDKDRQSPPAKKANLSPDRGKPSRSSA